MASPKPITVLYITGAGHSGSTLLDLLLGSVEGAFSLGEVNTLWPRAWREIDICGCRQQLGRCPVWSEALAASVGREPGFDPKRARREELRLTRLRNLPGLRFPRLLRAGDRRLFKAFIRRRGALYHELARVTGARVLVDSSKSPRYGLLLHQVPGLDVRFVHLVRDPRGVAYSSVRRQEPGGRSRRGREQGTPLRSAVGWLATELQILTGLSGAAPVLRLRYEDLCRQPEATISRLFRFAGASGEVGRFDPAGTDPRLSHISGGNTMRRQEGPIVVRTDERWRSELAAGIRRRVTALTLPLLVGYGYLPGRSRG